jgi:membrane-bound ClpP family serine protease
MLRRCSRAIVSVITDPILHMIFIAVGVSAIGAYFATLEPQ